MTEENNWFCLIIACFIVVMTVIWFIHTEKMNYANNGFEKRIVCTNYSKRWTKKQDKASNLITGSVKLYEPNKENENSFGQKYTLNGDWHATNKNSTFV